MPNPYSAAPAIIALAAAGALLFWLGLDSEPVQAPELSRPSGAPCLEAAPAMRAGHMRLLYAWRDKAVREGIRTHTASDGSKWRISLRESCLRCHEKTTFCSRCHEKNAVEPTCWSCHAPDETAPEGASPAQRNAPAPFSEGTQP